MLKRNGAFCSAGDWLGRNGEGRGWGREETNVSSVIPTETVGSTDFIDGEKVRGRGRGGGGGNSDVKAVLAQASLASLRESNVVSTDTVRDGLPGHLMRRAAPWTAKTLVRGVDVDVDGRTLTRSSVLQLEPFNNTPRLRVPLLNLRQVHI